MIGCSPKRKDLGGDGHLGRMGPWLGVVGSGLSGVPNRRKLCGERSNLRYALCARCASDPPPFVLP